jgi:hypothetical protein
MMLRYDVDAVGWGCGVKDNPNRAIVASPDEE